MLASRTASAAAAACALLLVGTSCTVGPRYNRPIAPMAPTYKELPPGNDQWKAATPSDGEIRGKWWEVFNDPQLNSLEETIDVSNQSLKQAEAIFRQARAIVAVNRSGYFPAIGTGPAINTSSRSGPTGNNTTATSFSLPVSASWEPDFWGRTRLSVENATTLAQASAADLQNTRLLLESELASDYFLLHGTDMTEKLLLDSLATYDRALQLTVNRYNGGVASKADVLQAQTQLDTTRAQATDLTIARSQFEHAIAVLTGQPPSNLTVPTGDILGTPPPVPVGLPSQLLERRPDIAGAERRVAAANANVGLAEAAYYPTLTLSGTLGLQGGSLANLFSWPGRFWSVGPSLSQTLFDFGRRRAQVQQFEATYDATIAAYRQTVLNGLQEVEDNLVALHNLETEAGQQAAAVRSAEQSLALELDRYKGGTVSYLDVITTQNIALADERAAVIILERRMISAVNLIRALGGGWNAANLPNPDQLRQGATSQNMKPIAATP